MTASWLPLRIVADEYRQARLRATYRADLRAAPHPSGRTRAGGAMTLAAMHRRLSNDGVFCGVGLEEAAHDGAHALAL